MLTRLTPRGHLTPDAAGAAIAALEAFGETGAVLLSRVIREVLRGKRRATAIRAPGRLPFDVSIETLVDRCRGSASFDEPRLRSGSASRPIWLRNLKHSSSVFPGLSMPALAPPDGLVSNWAYRVVAALAWNLKAWYGPVTLAPAARRDILRREFKQVLLTFIRIPCRIVATGRRLVYRLSTRSRHFLATFDPIRELEFT